MMEERELYPGWKTVRLLGRGSFGAVYEIERDVLGETERAALKKITIPQNESDIREMRSDGYDEESITQTLRMHLKSIVAEYSMMRKLNGFTNVVNCDDVRYTQHEDGMGWDIFIKMELLKPMVDGLPQRPMEENTARVGRDICKALVLCRKNGIVHRDIKPQNIFVSENGDYKLGDFGVAKTVEKTTGGTKIGTYKFMAPEVYNNQPYGAAADIYSLGLVLYWLLNERRMPFLPLPPAAMTAGMDEEARLRRLRGDALPEPKHGSAELKRIVLKACEFDPAKRYETADEMLADLEKVLASDTTGESAESVPEEMTTGTIGLRGIAPEKMKKPKKISLIPFILLGVLILAGAIAYYGWQHCWFGHVWGEADCVTAVTCSRCGAEDGEPLGHTWKDATCTEKKTCTVCGTTSGEPLGHTWQDATCTAKKTCTVCGAEEGELLPHNWEAATCLKVKTCADCGAEEGKLAEHIWKDATLLDRETCEVCGETRGDRLYLRNDAVELAGMHNVSGTAWEQNGTEMTPEFRASLVPGSVIEIRYTSAGGRLWLVFPGASKGWTRVGNQSSNCNGSVCEVRYEDIAAELGEAVAQWGDVLQCESDGNWSVTSVKVGTPVALTEHTVHEWTDATCTELSACRVCGLTIGELLPHDYAPATCEERQYCRVCDKTEGEPAGHQWLDPTCTEPSICSVCKKESGEPLGHTWQDATCTELKTCTVCGTQEGELLPHQWREATCTTPQTCIVCEAQEGELLPHQWRDATCTAPKICIVCEAEEGEPLPHDWEAATCIKLQTCKVCGAQEGELADHIWEEANLIAPETCTICGTTRGDRKSMSADSTALEGMSGISGDAMVRNGTLMTPEFRAALVPGSVIEIRYSSSGGKIWLVFPAAEKGWTRIQEKSALCNGSICEIRFEDIAQELGEDVSKWGDTIQCESDGSWKVTSVKVGQPVVLEDHKEHQWADATCTRSQYCRICGIETGSPLEHTLQAATITDPMICSVCGARQGMPLNVMSDKISHPHYFEGVENTVDPYFWGQTIYQRSEVTSVVFSQTDRVPSNAWDVSYNSDGRIMAWMENGKLSIASAETILLPKNSGGMFYCFENVESIRFNHLIDTSMVENMCSMFRGCKNLKEIDLSDFKTDNVVYMGAMFSECASLTSLDVSGFNTEKTLETRWMFEKCTGLTTLDLRNFNTKNVQSMIGMFHSMSGLASLDLSGFDTSSATDMYYLFNGCASLTELDLSGFDTSNVTGMACMFRGCTSLSSLNLTGFDTAKVMDMRFMFADCASLTSLDVTGFNTARVANMANMFSGCSSLTSLDVSGFDTKNVVEMRWMFENCTDLTSLDLRNFNTKKVELMHGMFSGASGLTALNLSSFDTSGVADMSKLFDGCASLTKLDLSGFTTSNVTDMSYMFRGCTALTSLNLRRFDTSKVADMMCMFADCASLTSLDVTGFDTAQVTNMANMFSGCSSLTSLDVSGFNTKNVVGMQWMFEKCSALTELNLHNFDTRWVESMQGMFSNSTSLTALDLSAFDTENVVDMSYMFGGCISLTSLNLAHFKTEKVINMSLMFAWCVELNQVDLSGFNTANVVDMTGMFQECRKLQTVLKSPAFDTSNVVQTESMFDGCPISF